MLRWTILEISKRRGLTRLPRQITAERTPYNCYRNKFSTAAKGPEPNKKAAESGSGAGTVMAGAAFISVAGVVFYHNGYFDEFLGKMAHAPLKTVDIEGSKDAKEPIVLSRAEEPVPSMVEVKATEEKIDPHTDTTGSQESAKQEEPSVVRMNDSTLNQEKVLPELHGDKLTADGDDQKSVTSTTDILIGDTDTKPNEKYEMSDSTIPPTQQTETESEDEAPHSLTKITPEDSSVESVDSATPLLDAYSLREKSEEAIGSLASKDLSVPVDDATRKKDLSDAYVSDDGKLVLDFLQAIHAAEKRQAELDAHVFAEEKKMLKEKYEQELRDARARELMYAEEAAILDKELNKERVKAVAAMKSLQEKADEKLKMELEQKGKEAEQELKRVEELAKAELAATIAKEKAGQIEKMVEANLHIDALCMAFFARSEEARLTHSVHKLALGALALEDALLKGLPVQKDIEALHKYLEGVDRDPLIDLVLSSLPEEARYSGTDTLLQLNKKFDALKVTLRHFSFIPPGGGGILAHSVAHLASALKVKETGDFDGGVESIISRVDNYLAEGKLVEAADTLEEGLKGTQAAEVVNDWVTKARNRAITEQALTLLQSYATSISLV